MGISALDGLINAYVAINSLRQFMKDGVRIHGIITKGGEAANIVPRYAEARFVLRAPTRAELEVVKEKVYQAARHSAEAVGAKMEICEGMAYAERNNNNVTLAGVFKENLAAMGVEVSPPPKQGGMGSSDIGNVSQVTATTIHPYIKIAPLDVTAHPVAFREAAGSDQGMVGLNHAAKASAMTAYDLCKDKDILQDVREEFVAWKLGKNS